MSEDMGECIFVSVLVICITVLTIFCWGDPDLLDALIKLANK